MTAELPVTQATLDAAAQAMYESRPAHLRHPAWADLAVPFRGLWLELAAAALPVLAAAIEQQARADEREQIVTLLDRRIASKHLTEDAIKWIRFARSVIQADANSRTGAAIARAGTSGGGS